MKRHAGHEFATVMAAVIFTAILGGLRCGLRCGFADEPDFAASSHRLSAEQRARIDALALSTDDVSRKTVIDSYAKIVEWGKFYDDVTGWMISRTPLPAEEELRRAAVVHRQILKDTKIGPTPLAAERTLAKLVETLPVRMRPKSFEFSLVVIEDREQHDEADLFALHPCRNAGFELENCLDVLRMAIAENLPKPDSNRDDDPETRTRLRRLKHCQYELDGISNGDQFGLFEFDRSEGVIKQVADNALDDNARGIIFVHGMESDLGRFRSMMKHIAAQDAAKQIRILGFQYPHDQSLARWGLFLKHELERVAKSAEGLDFVCHSAGGLIFRHYAEVSGGKFRKAVFLGTPHGGSNLAELRPIIEAKQFVGSLKFGILTPLEKIVTNGQGQIGFDLQPDSLFLRHLNQQPPTMNRSRYHNICGRALSRGTAFLLRTGIVALRAAARRGCANSGNGDLLRRTAMQWVEQLRMPREATDGDLAVSVESATLKDAASNATFPVNHRTLTSDPEVMKHVTEIVLN